MSKSELKRRVIQLGNKALEAVKDVGENIEPKIKERVAPVARKVCDWAEDR